MICYAHFSSIQWNLDITKGKYVRYNEVSLYRGSFPYILLSLGLKKTVRYVENFVI